MYYTLMTVAGFFGAYTYLLRGNVFCNAQTGNVALMGMALGAVVGTVFCNRLMGKAIWITGLPLAVIFFALLHADLITEKNMVERKPSGH